MPLGIYVETAVAQDGAFTVAPYDGVTHKAADPDKETYEILEWQQPPLLLRDGIVHNIARRGNRGAAAQHQSKDDHWPCAGVRSAKQKGPGQRIGEYLSPITGGT